MITKRLIKLVLPKIKGHPANIIKIVPITVNPILRNNKFIANGIIAKKINKT